MDTAIKETLGKAITAHQAWTQTFAEAIASGKHDDVILRRAGSDDLCAFGQWLYDLDDETKATPAYRQIKDRHYCFHVEAGVVARLLLEGNHGAARAALQGSYQDASAELLAALQRLRNGE